jgi:Rieske 2Fe-2S family protein
MDIDETATRTRNGQERRRHPAARQLLPPAPEAHHDGAWYQRKQRQLFRLTWKRVGQTRDLPEPGDDLTADIGGGSVAVVRSDDDRLRAFHNVCRHRSANILDHTGNFRTIVHPRNGPQFLAAA